MSYRFPHISWETAARCLSQQTSSAQEQTPSEGVRLIEPCRRLVKSTRKYHQFSKQELASKLYLKTEDLAALETGSAAVPKHVAVMVLFALNINLDSVCFF